MKNILVVIDMQNDFIDGSLGSDEAKSIVSNVVEKVSEFNGKICFTMDTHHDDYLNTKEGKNLPVTHCVKNSHGWKIVNELKNYAEAGDSVIFEKNTFGSIKLAKYLKEMNDIEKIDSIELIGVCTDICVVSNAILLKSYLPEVEISVDSKCCAGVTPYKNDCALETMRSCQITIL